MHKLTLAAYAIGLLASPENEWRRMRDLSGSRSVGYGGGLIYLFIMALLPVIAWYYGVTVTGWQVADGEVVRLTPDSALWLVSLFYLAMVVSVCCIGYFVHWMSINYGAESSMLKGIFVVSYCATPMFIAGLVGFYPILWLDMLVGVLAVGHALYLLYVGIPIVMDIPKERGFLFASAILAVCLVILMAMMGATVILWDMGVMPVFTD